MSSNIAPNIFNVQDIFFQLYGAVPPHISQLLPTQPVKNPNTINQLYTQRTTTLKGTPLYGLSDTLGREVFCPLTFTIGDNVYNFPYAVIGMKNKIEIKKTPMIERGGVVIEEMGAGAWAFSIKGFLMNPDLQFPDDQLDMLNQLFTQRVPVSMSSALTDIFLAKNDQVVIEELELPMKPKVIGVRDFSMIVSQDNILDLYSIA
jgi:hypothetical protein